jgi:NAD(P)-dependent dehydrogenase (short-subunit alcohol dehydrogenase family)
MSSYAVYPSLQDRGVLITGGATGIGETLVEAFAAQGAKVAFIDLAADEGHALAARLAGSRHAPQFMAADLSRVDALRDAIATLRERTGPFTVLLNNAANDRRHAVEETTPEFWDASVAVNLKHQFFTAQAVLPDMKAAGFGSIVNFGSIGLGHDREAAQALGHRRDQEGNRQGPVHRPAADAAAHRCDGVVPGRR